MGKQKHKGAKSKSKNIKKNSYKNVENNKEKDSSKKNSNQSTDKSKETNKKGKKEGFWKRHRKLAIFIKIIFVLILLLAIAGAGILVALLKNDEWDVSKLKISNIDTIIYDKDGVEIANVSGEEKRRIVTLDEMPKQLKDAYISIEDERFEKHKGVDIKRTFGATVTYILNKGKSSYGGSTITQQLIKNLMKDDDDSGVAGIKRKIREISRAYKTEQVLSKDQILELYLNTIFVGGEGNLCGVALGARYYFNKSVGDLDLAECAFLVGINHSPNTYNPFKENPNTELIKKRTNTVLNKMNELGKINNEEYESAKAEVEQGLKFEKGNTSTNSTMSYLARAALNQVIQDYANKNNISVDSAKTFIAGGGYKIYTTQDSKIQSGMEEIYRSGDHIYEGVAENDDGSKVNEGHTQSAMVLIDHKTGNVVGCMGGLGDDVDSNGQNRATQAKRQPGSSIKPLAAVAPALEAGIITAATVYDESRTSFGSYSPNPHSGFGLVTVRKAIAFSANTVNVKILSEVGPGNSIDFMRKLGISTLVKSSENSEHNDENLPLVLGGVTNGITPLEMAEAYATIANDGMHITPTFYTKVEDEQGNVILEPEQEKTRVISEGNAYILKSILKGPIEDGDGTAPYCRISGQDAAGKTGTTDDNHDRWFCGFTNYYTAATWYGFDIAENLYYAGANSTNRAARLWASVMKMVHEDLPSATFEKPSNIVSAKICKDSGKVAVEACTNTYTEYFVKGTVPGDCEGHEKLTICTETGKIATEYCKNTEEKIYTKKPEKEDTTSWRTNNEEKYDVPTETCNVHTKKEVVMPNVVGKTKDEAMKILKDLKLKVVVETEESSKKAGTVIKQSKKEGSKLSDGDSVTITVGKGKNDDGSENEIDDGNTVDGNTAGGNNTIDNNVDTENKVV